MKRPIERGLAGRLPYAAIGAGPPVAVLAGLGPTTGVDGDQTVRIALAPFERLADRRRVVLFNRRPRLPRGITFAQLAAEHADAIRAGIGAPCNVIGVSTGGSLAQQLAADHPDVISKLVLASTGCRLEGYAKTMQRQVAARIRGGAPRRAMALLAAAIVPPRRGRIPAALVALAVAPQLLENPYDLDDMATTIEAEDTFDLARCPRIAAPTLIVVGADDRFYSDAVVSETAALIPGSELLSLAGRGHVTALADHRGAEAIDAFLA